MPFSWVCLSPAADWYLYARYGVFVGSGPAKLNNVISENSWHKFLPKMAGHEEVSAWFKTVQHFFEWKSVES